MSTSNSTSFHDTQFVAFCFPGGWSWWKGVIGAILMLLLLLALFANFILLLVIWTERRLHTPMYYFVCCVSLLDLASCLIIVPSVLDGLFFHLKTINVSICFLEIYFIILLPAIQSGVFMLMAYDRYVAICKPLQYPIILSNNRVITAITVTILRSCIFVMPLAVLPAQLNYCLGKVIQKCLCNLKITNLACDSNPLIGIYNLTIMFFTSGFDIFFITFSYFMIIRAVLRLPFKGASSKAFSTCGSHFILISYFYSSVTVLLISNILENRIPNSVRTLISILFYNLPPVINPVVYSLRTKEFMENILAKLKMFK